GLGYGYDVLRTLVDLVGAAYAKEILYTARKFSAREAYDMGLVNRVVPQESLEEYVNGYVENIAGNAPLTIRAAKIVISEILKDLVSRDLEMCNRLIDTCYESDDYKEGRQAFMEKRKPIFKAR
ncbi:MAG TPA: enoyl-CoA hydratase-related protein, partial [Desulfobacterales bacterium]|nr:enoyl-CoA hydratase-related protein [Desulfobacterales bacterium]